MKCIITTLHIRHLDTSPFWSDWVGQSRHHSQGNQSFGSVKDGWTPDDLAELTNDSPQHYFKLMCNDGRVSRQQRTERSSTKHCVWESSLRRCTTCLGTTSARSANVSAPVLDCRCRTPTSRPFES